MVSHLQIFANQKLAEVVNLTDASMIYSRDFVKNLTLTNFSCSSRYSMSLVINYYTNNLTLSSDPVDFNTFEGESPKFFLEKAACFNLILLTH